MDADVRRRLEVEVLAALSRAAAAPMQWGKDDCGLWCADVIRAALGYDPAAELRGRYATQEEAHRLMGKAGLPFAIKRAAKSCGWQPVVPADAKAGDIGMMMQDIGGRLMPVALICRAPGWFAGRGSGGAVLLPSRLVRVAWAVV